MAESRMEDNLPGDVREIWVGSIVIDCTNFGEMLVFWSEALHYSPRDPPKSGWVVLRDPKGLGPNVGLNETREGPPNDYRPHMDLYASDPLAEVQRLVKLGAKMVRPPEEGQTSSLLLTRTATSSMS